MPRKRPSELTLKRLFALSGNRCAFPNCPHSIVEGDSLIGEICHIEAANEGGERYNAQQSDDERCAFENLILLCANHHRLTNDVEKFPVEAMLLMKQEHELRSAKAPFQVSDNIMIEALKSEIYCNSLSLNATTAHINIVNGPSKSELPNIQPDFNRIHLGNQFMPPFVVLTLNFSLPLVNKSESMAKDWAIHIGAPHMVVESTDEKFNKTIPADSEIMLYSKKPVFPRQETSLWFTLKVRVNYELESKNKFKKLVFDPIGLGITEDLPITMTVYCGNSKPKSYNYIVQSKVYLARLNDYYARKEERKTKDHY